LMSEDNGFAQEVELLKRMIADWAIDATEWLRVQIFSPIVS